MRPPRGIRRDLLLSVGDGAGYGVMAGVAEVYLPAFALAIGLPAVIAGLVATAPLLAGGILQLLAPRAIARTPNLRTWIVWCMVIQALAFVPLVVLALIGAPAASFAPVLFGSAALYWAAGMGVSAAWNPWMARVVPSRVRSKFFGRRQGLVQGTMLVGLVGAGAALQIAAGTDHVHHVYAVMFGLACIARLISALMIAKMGVGVDVSATSRMRLRSVPGKLRGTPRARLLAYFVTTGAAATLSGTFVTPYLLDNEGLSYVQYSIFTATIVLAKILFSALLGRVMHRLGVQYVLGACAIAITLIPIMFMASAYYPWLLFIQFYSGIAWAGFELGILIVLFDADDDGERTTMQVAFGALQAIGNSGAAFAGAALLAGLGSGDAAYFWLYMVSFVARLFAGLLVVRNLPIVMAQLPATIVVKSWTLALRPWGGTIVRPIVEGIGRLRRER